LLLLLLLLLHQVLGCGTILKKLRKVYCLRLGICPSCMKVGQLKLAVLMVKGLCS
jgi:hypothetical protein